MIVPVKTLSRQEPIAVVTSAPVSGAAAFGLNLYLLFVISWFLHLGSRVPILGTIRVDLILVCVLTALAFASRPMERTPVTTTDKILRVLILYAVLSIPFVEWPGSVVRSGIPEFVKAVVFYYFTVAFVRTEGDLKKFVAVFLACQLFRVLEPLYLHLTEGYWGNYAYMATQEWLARLSGAPSDVINPNGLAFVICTILPFLYFLQGQSWVNRLAFLFFTPACLYALALTGSRSGFVGLMVIFLSILVKSRQRVLIGVTGTVLLVFGFAFLSDDQQDRYLSLFGAGPKNEITAEGRIEGVKSNFRVASRRPIFGHGLGTSLEANANFGATAQPAHNLFAELAQELGYVGLLVFLLFIKAIFSEFSEHRKRLAGGRAEGFLPGVVAAMQVWLWMNLFASLASYGLSSFEWYLFAGFSVVLKRLAVPAYANKTAVSHKARER